MNTSTIQGTILHQREGMIVAVQPCSVPHKILIVDNDEATRAGLKQLLERAGYQVMAVATFGEGRFALAESAPDLLIADVRLGEFNGLQLVATNPRPIPAIIVTGYPDSVLQADALRLGAEYVVKPVSPSGLIALIKQKLEAPSENAPLFSRARRWERKRVSGDLSARVGGSPARILDVSYGGLRFEFERQAERALPPSFTLDLPAAGLSVPVELVWTTRSSGARWICGAALAQHEEEAARAWHGLVDATA